VRAAVPAHGAGGTVPAELVTAESSETE
jgi:hypothetical protein